MAWRKLAETAANLGLNDDPDCGPLADYIEIRLELALVRRSRTMYWTIAAATPFVIGFFVYAGFVDWVLWFLGIGILATYIRWLWNEHRYRLAVFARAAEQGLG